MKLDTSHTTSIIMHTLKLRFSAFPRLYQREWILSDTLVLFSPVRSRVIQMSQILLRHVIGECIRVPSIWDIMHEVQ
jgi:hypothetical protein